jgi:FkbM family methyltransferase
MLIPLDKLVEHFKLNITGVLHIGAHECEEFLSYLIQKIPKEHIFWIEAMKDKVIEMKNKNKNINIIEAVVSDKDGEEVTFNITNNGQSSSFLELGTHEKHHPQVHVVKKEKMITSRMDTIIEKESIKMNNINFLNLDIQGAELKALKGLGKYIDNIDYIYTEVNTEKVYKDCALMSEIDEFLKEKGFERKCEAIYKQYGWGDAFYMRV